MTAPLTPSEKMAKLKALQTDNAVISDLLDRSVTHSAVHPTRFKIVVHEIASSAAFLRTELRNYPSRIDTIALLAYLASPPGHDVKL